MSCHVHALNIILLEAYSSSSQAVQKKLAMRDHEVLFGELAHPLTRPDTLRLARSFASRSTLACRGRIVVDFALSVHFSLSGIVGAAGTISAAFVNHVDVYVSRYVMWTHVCAYIRY